MQLATNNRRGFMRSVSEAKTFAIARGKLVEEARLIVDNRAACRLPGGSRSKFHRRLGINRPCVVRSMQ